MFKNYLKIAIRHLWRQRWYSLINISGLAIGFTACFFILLYVNFELSYDQFYSKKDRIYRVVSNIKTPTSTRDNIPVAAWAVPLHLKEDFEEITKATRVLYTRFTIRNNEIKYIEDDVTFVDNDFFEIFDFKLIHGNQKEVLKNPYSIILSQHIAKKYFGDENPIGKTLNIDHEGDILTVTGVMEDFPENSHIKANVIIPIKLITEHLDKDENLDNAWGNYSPYAYILVNKQTECKKLESKFPDFIERHNGEASRKNQMFATLLLEPFSTVYLYSKRKDYINGNIQIVHIFTVIALFILIIVSINFINLATARSVERAKEVGIRKVLGSERIHLAFQFLGESLIISLLAFFISIILIFLFAPSLNILIEKNIFTDFISHLSTTGILFITALIVGLLSGIYPAIILSSFKPIQVLKKNFSSRSKGGGIRKFLVITQFSISIFLIISTLITYYQMKFIYNKNLGFSKEEILVLNGVRTKKSEVFKNRIKASNDIKMASTTASVPGKGFSRAYSILESKAGNMQIASVYLAFIDYDYIPSLEMKLIEGRNFSREFASDSTSAMIINETLVKLLGYISPKEAIGARFDQWGRKGKIIGVIQDFNYESIENKIAPLSLRIDKKYNEQLLIKLKTKDFNKTLAFIKQNWEEIYPDVPFDHYFLNDSLNKQYKNREQTNSLILHLTLLTIFLSCLGLLGLSAYSTHQRKKEIGVRKVNGASITSIVALFSTEFIKLVTIAFAIATPIAWYLMNNWLQDFAYRITIQWWMFAIAGGIAIGIALVTVGFHAIKAAITNPIKSLKTE